MKPADVCIAVLVAVIWGLAFVASRIALNEFSPELMTTLRFAIAALPCLFVARPKVSWSVLASISFTLFLGQFLAQAFAIAHGVPVGLSSVIVQSQALFTIGFAALLFRERPGAWQTVGIGVATVGLLMICGTVGYDFSVGAFAILMISPLSFAAGNLLPARLMPMFDLFAWLCWSRRSVALTLVSNGPQPTWHALTHVADRLLCMIGLGGVSTSIAYWLWAGCCGLSCGAGGAVRASGAVRRSAASSVVFGETFGRCGSQGWSRSSAALPSCCCRSGLRP
jgi:O-acetylserine/cysteine efflux transporter